jgi:hypothetical protein
VLAALVRIDLVQPRHLVTGLGDQAGVENAPVNDVPVTLIALPRIQDAGGHPATPPGRSHVLPLEKYCYINEFTSKKLS